VVSGFVITLGSTVIGGSVLAWIGGRTLFRRISKTANGAAVQRLDLILGWTLLLIGLASLSIGLFFILGIFILSE
jgi:hypothetical protein